jgi:hypothetical protein
VIGKIIIGKSFRGCLAYCLDKQEAEVLSYNLCFGDKKELTSQFNEVRSLNKNLSKPVQHITLSFPRGERLTKAKLESIASDCAKDLGFEKNQYLVILHKDTGHPHLHIVSNRVGFDGKTVKDGNNFRRMADYCRRIEKKHGLTVVLSPRKFLPKEQRQEPRLDTRKEKLRADIQSCLIRARNYQEFEKMIKELKYGIYKARGIAFTDEKKVRTKGSEVGYSLRTIERILALPKEHKGLILAKQKKPALKPSKQPEGHAGQLKQADSLAENLLKPEIGRGGPAPGLIVKKRERKKGPKRPLF